MAKLDIIGSYETELDIHITPVTLNPTTGKKFATIQEELDYVIQSLRNQAVKEILAQQKTLIDNQVTQMIALMKKDLGRNNDYLTQPSRQTIYSSTQPLLSDNRRSFSIQN